MSSYRSHKEKTLLEQVERALTPEEESALFTPAGYDFREAEKGGYSNYSYWQSTFRAFFKNRVAVFQAIQVADPVTSMGRWKRSLPRSWRKR